MAMSVGQADATVPGLLQGCPDKARTESSWTGGNNQLSGQEISVFVEGKWQTCWERAKQGREG